MTDRYTGSKAKHGSREVVDAPPIALTEDYKRALHTLRFTDRGLAVTAYWRDNAVCIATDREVSDAEPVTKVFTEPLFAALWIQQYTGTKSSTAQLIRGIENLRLACITDLHIDSESDCGDPQPCVDCKGTGEYRGFNAPVEPCRTCAGVGEELDWTDDTAKELYEDGSAANAFEVALGPNLVGYADPMCAIEPYSHYRDACIYNEMMHKKLGE